MFRRVIGLVAAMGMLVACGGAPVATAPSESTAQAVQPTVAPTTEVAQTSAPATDTAQTAAPIPPDAASDTATPDATVDAATTTTVEATTAAGGADTYPVVIEHKYGSTEITERPERIVTVGLTDQDPLLALGVAPVGVTEWFGEQPYAAWPWARPLLGDAQPTVVGDAATVNFEGITALQPDLILALSSGVTQEQYDLLAQIAPTVAQPADLVDYGISWQTQTRTVGEILGESAKAEALVKAVEDQIAAVRAEHPEFEGATSVVATPYQGIWLYGEQDVRGRFLTDLGFKLPDGLNEITGAEFGGNLSEERADLLDVDVIIWLDPDDAQGPLGGPVYASLPVHTEGREVFVDSFDDPLGAATSFVTVLSMPFLLDGIVPRMADAIDGDPNTVVATSVPVAPAAATATAAP